MDESIKVTCRITIGISESGLTQQLTVDPDTSKRKIIELLSQIMAEEKPEFEPIVSKLQRYCFENPFGN